MLLILRISVVFGSRRHCARTGTEMGKCFLCWTILNNWGQVRKTGQLQYASVFVLHGKFWSWLTLQLISCSDCLVLLLLFLAAVETGPLDSRQVPRTRKQNRTTIELLRLLNQDTLWISLSFQNFPWPLAQNAEGYTTSFPSLPLVTWKNIYRLQRLIQNLGNRPFTNINQWTDLSRLGTSQHVTWKSLAIFHPFANLKSFHDWFIVVMWKIGEWFQICWGCLLVWIRLRYLAIQHIMAVATYSGWKTEDGTNF